MSATTRRILGVDPGTRVTGWGVIDHHGNRSTLVACGAVRTGVGKSNPSTMGGRLAEIHRGLTAVVREYAPGTLAVERQFFGVNANSAMVTGMARGVAILTAGEAGIAVHEYPPATVKKAVTANGSASKEQVAGMVRVLLGLAAAPEPQDVTDALAVALADAHRGGLGAQSSDDPTGSAQADDTPAAAALRAARRKPRAGPRLPRRAKRG